VSQKITLTILVFRSELKSIDGDLRCVVVLQKVRNRSGL
jgi:hypothetical protein